MNSKPQQEILKISIAFIDKRSIRLFGTKNTGNFEVERKYRDLVILRKNLKKQWPGCFIPYLPRHFSHMTENDLIKATENFFLKIISIIFLYQSQEFQDFINDSRDYSKIVYKFWSISELYEKYQNTFSHFLVNDYDENYINLSSEYFEISRQKLVNFKEICSFTSTNYENYAKNLSGVLNKLNSVGNQLANIEKTVDLRDEGINPYRIIENWIHSKIYDNIGMIKAINSRKLLKRLREKLEDQISQLHNSYQKINNGKKSLLQRFGNKTNEEIKDNVFYDLIVKKNELEMLDITEKIIDCKLIYNEIPQFKKNEEYHYMSIMKSFINANVDEFSSLISQSKKMNLTHNTTI